MSNRNTGRGQHGNNDVVYYRLSLICCLIIVPAPVLADSLRFGLQGKFIQVGRIGEQDFPTLPV